MRGARRAQGHRHRVCAGAGWGTTRDERDHEVQRCPETGVHDVPRHQNWCPGSNLPSAGVSPSRLGKLQWLHRRSSKRSVRAGAPGRNRTCDTRFRKRRVTWSFGGAARREPRLPRRLRIRGAARRDGPGGCPPRSPKRRHTQICSTSAHSAQFSKRIGSPTPAGPCAPAANAKHPALEVMTPRSTPKSHLVGSCPHRRVVRQLQS